MKKIILFFLLLCIVVLPINGNAQSINNFTDSLGKVTDSSASINQTNTTAKIDTASNTKLLGIAERQYQILKQHPYFNLLAKAAPPAYQLKIAQQGKEILFYSLLVLVLYFAIIKSVFSKYFADYLGLFFKTALKQKQIKQQLAQNSLPSLLFNILFVLSSSYYIVLLLYKSMAAPTYPIWQYYIGTLLLVTVVYVFKYLLLKFIGWLLQMKNITESYIFVVFLINKIIGVFIIPFLFLIALSTSVLQNMAVTLSYIFLAAVIVYRFSFAYKLFQQNKNITFFHFILYVAAFEILPILAFIKFVLNYLK